MANDDRIAVRLSAELKKRLVKVCEETGLDEPTAIRALVDAFCERVEQDGGIWLPLKVISKNQKVPFDSTVVLPTPARGSASINEEAPPTPRNAPVSTPAPERLRKTRAVMREIAKKTTPPTP